MRKYDRYNLTFILKLVEEVESGRISMSGAQDKYGIGGNTTVRKWVDKYGTLGNRKTREISAMNKLELEIERLKKEKQLLESALAQSHMKILSLETLIEVYEEDKGEKKSSVKEQLTSFLKKEKKKNKDTPT